MGNKCMSKKSINENTTDISRKNSNARPESRVLESKMEHSGRSSQKVMNPSASHNNLGDSNYGGSFEKSSSEVPQAIRPVSTTMAGNPH